MLLDICQYLGDQDHVELFLFTTLHNSFHPQGLSIASDPPYLEPLLRNLSTPAPELKHFEMQNRSVVESDTKLPAISGGRTPKLISRSLRWFRINLRDFNFPSVQFCDDKLPRSESNILRKMPFAQIHRNLPPIHLKRPPFPLIDEFALQELGLDKTACTTSLLDHLIPQSARR